MDTTTVLEMIKQLNSTITFYNVFEVDEHDTTSYKAGKRDSLIEFKDHLQSFIESQLSVAENNTGE